MGSRTIWAVAQLRDGNLHPGSHEAVAAARQLAEATGGAAEAVVLGAEVAAAAQALAGSGVAAVRTAEHPALAAYTPGAWVGVLAGAVREHGPAAVVLPHTYQTVDFLPRLAQELGAALVPEAVSFRLDGERLVFKRPVLGGKLEAEVAARGDGPVLVSVQAGAFAAGEGGAGAAPIEALALAAEPASDREILAVEQASAQEVDLTQADRIVAVGRGVGGPEKLDAVRELAAALGAELGASRPVIDGGWLPRDRQIGSSGQTVAPKLYLALGISGAIQHLVGMKGSQVVAAINKDRNAPIFSVSRVGVVGDLHEILPHLIEAVRTARGS